jgi:hypothetical protein
VDTPKISAFPDERDRSAEWRWRKAAKDPEVTAEKLLDRGPGLRPARLPAKKGPRNTGLGS